jgi:outer membrane protein OmpA-like peptidoglycan-associated protein
MMPNRTRLMMPLLAWLVMALLGCSSQPKLQVTLLPQTNTQGQALATAVSVQTPLQRVVLDQPYASLQMDDQGRITETLSSAQAIASRYKHLLDATPPAAEKWTLYFVNGQTDLTPESKALLPTLLQRLNLRQGGELMLTGHTDRTGTHEVNDPLSLQRAQSVAQQLVSAGIHPDRISTAGRGKREPLVNTADNVPEPLNRRVEVILR